MKTSRSAVYPVVLGNKHIETEKDADELNRSGKEYIQLLYVVSISIVNINCTFCYTKRNYPRCKIFISISISSKWDINFIFLLAYTWNKHLKLKHYVWCEYLIKLEISPVFVTDFYLIGSCKQTFKRCKKPKYKI